MSSSAIEEEEEILLSIFPEELEKVNENTFRIRIDIDPDECRVGAPPTVFLTAQLPATYPDAVPILHVESLAREESVGGQHDGPLTAAEKGELSTTLGALSEENLGTAMLFTLVSSLKEDVTAMLDRRVTQADEAKKETQRLVEAEEQKRFEGTKVTQESFRAWNALFMAEMTRRQGEEEEAARRQAARTGGAAAAAGERKLTGRQLFEGDKTLAQSDVKIGDAGDVEFDFSKFDRTTRHRDSEDEDEVQHWDAE